ncbi:MAG: tRNA uridine-5-carboxymethylaminomethyl(34) synthesis GTPase MnmE [Candidatus Latescibacteria bacterium]|nr:tRNA uridine-5-carboxymethylaminomethyl(34) synthesis GTPase MnmE [Candidatus Latescibacterota bacterium]
MMRSSDTDTIVAIATAPGEGAIGIVRLSGPQAIFLSDQCYRGRIRLQDATPRTLSYGHFISSGQDLDEVLASVMYAPNSYTGEDTVEFNGHGGPFLLRRVVESLVILGARVALPGEFTKRAFLNGKLDLSQAQAVADMIAAPSELSLQSAYFQLRGGLKKRFNTMSESLLQVAMLLEAGLDFSEDVQIDIDRVRISLQHTLSEIELLVSSYHQGKLIREGVLVALVGKPNVGKSSLMNRLLEEDRAIVTDIPGTTRDTIEEAIDLEGIRATLVDTAGIRETTDPVEREGARRSRQFIERADLVLFIVDGSLPPSPDDEVLLTRSDLSAGFLVLNKSDLNIHSDWNTFLSAKRIVISALDGSGIPNLRQCIRERLIGQTVLSTEIITQERQMLALKQGQDGLLHALESLELGNPGELIAMDVRIALDALSDIIGETTADDVLDQIFSTFCIGK